MLNQDKTGVRQAQHHIHLVIMMLYRLYVLDPKLALWSLNPEPTAGV